MKDKAVMCLQMYLTFLKIGLFTFGGGLNILAQIQKTYVEKRGYMTQEELLDTFCVGRSLPGTMVTNVAYLFGHHCGGILCGIACVLGLVTAPTLILMVVAVFYDQFRDNPYIAKFMLGVRSAVVPIILTAVLKMLKAAFPHWICMPIAVVAFVMFHFLGWNSLVVVGIGAVCGLAIYNWVQAGKAVTQ